MMSSMLRDRCCSGIKAGAAAVTVKGGCKRVEILARYDVFCGKQVINLIAGITVTVEQHRKVGVIGFHTRQNRTEADTGDAFQTAEVTRMDSFPFPDFSVQMAEQTETHGGAEFVHLRIAADIRNLLGAVNAEVFQVVQLCAQGGIAVADGTAFNGMENLGCMEGEHRGVSEAGGTDAVFHNTEGMGGIVNDFQMMAGGNIRNGFGVAEVAVDMHGEDGNGFIRDESFDFGSVDGVRLRINVTENGGAAAADNGVRSGGEGERCGNDFTVKIQSGNDVFQSQMAVGKQRDVFRTEIVLQFFLQTEMLLSHIGEEAAFPERSDFLTVFLKGGHGGTGDIDNLRHGLKSFQMSVLILEAR